MNSTTNQPTADQVNAALLSIRIASALAFLYHGSAILFGAFGGPGPEKFATAGLRLLRPCQIALPACVVGLLLGQTTADLKILLRGWLRLSTIA